MNAWSSIKGSYLEIQVGVVGCGLEYVKQHFHNKGQS